jgi:hypothetical protein
MAAIGLIPPRARSSASTRAARCANRIGSVDFLFRAGVRTEACSSYSHEVGTGPASGCETVSMEYHHGEVLVHPSRTHGAPYQAVS